MITDFKRSIVLSFCFLLASRAVYAQESDQAKPEATEQAKPKKKSGKPKQSSGKGKYATEAEASRYCSADNIVWHSGEDNLDYYPGNPGYGKKPGGFVCQGGIPAGDESAPRRKSRN